MASMAFLLFAGAINGKVASIRFDPLHFFKQIEVSSYHLTNDAVV
jgi:hypothetical protein